MSNRWALQALLTRANEIGMLAQQVDFDPSEERIGVRSVQDVEPILKRNRELRLHRPNNGYTPSRDLQHVATIPLIVVHQWLKEGLNVYDPNSTKEILRRLNDSEWKELRASEGQL